MRVAIVDDHRGVRALLRQLLSLEPSVVVVVEVDDGERAAEAVIESRAELVIMDFHMPLVDGVEATRRVKTASPAALVVAFSSATDGAVAAAFEAAGAVAYFEKGQIVELLSYVRALAEGRE